MTQYKTPRQPLVFQKLSTAVAEQSETLFALIPQEELLRHGGHIIALSITNRRYIFVKSLEELQRVADDTFGEDDHVVIRGVDTVAAQNLAEEMEPSSGPLH